MGNKQNRYDEDFKASAVKMVVEKGRTVNSVSKDLGVSEPALRRWVNSVIEPEDISNKRIKELEAENKALKKERDEARETADILKKSLGIFART